MGLTLQDLKIYGDYFLWTKAEAVLMHDRIIHCSEREKHLPLQEILSTLEQAKRLLTAKVYRESLMDNQHSENIKSLYRQISFEMESWNLRFHK